MPTVLVPPERLERWVDNFGTRHGTAALALDDGLLLGTADDGATFRARAPFDRRLEAPTVTSLVVACAPPANWGLLLVRKGGFAIARLRAAALVEHKIGQRHVQGRTKAGGQSQQRFARRRDNQARAAYDAAASHAARVLAGVPLLVTGGDHVAVDAVLEAWTEHGDVIGGWLAVPEPRRAVLDQAIADAGSVVVEVDNG